MKKLLIFFLLMVCMVLSPVAPAFSAESRPDQMQRPLEGQKPPLSIRPDLSCYFAQELNAGMQLWVQNNTSEKSTWFNVHYEAVKDGVKVLDSNFFVTNMAGNYNNHIDLIPCTQGLKFTATVDSGENVTEMTETNNTCAYNCDGPLHIIKPPAEKNISPVIPKAR